MRKPHTDRCALCKQTSAVMEYVATAPNGYTQKNVELCETCADEAELLYGITVELPEED